MHSLPRLICAALLALIALAPTARASGDSALTREDDQATMSPDGSTIAFISDKNGWPGLWLANGDGSAPRELLNWQSITINDPAWSRDSKNIVFSSNIDSMGYDLWTSDIQGKDQYRLTRDAGINGAPRYSPDGKTILFVSNRTGKRELWLMNADGSNQHALGLQDLIVNTPSWSPDGKAIVYSGCVRPPSGGSLSEGRCNLYTAPVDASVTKQITMGKVTAITDGQFQDWDPDWGPEGIVFSSSRNGGHTLWLIDADGNNLREIKTGAGIALYPRWTNTRHKIIYINLVKTALTVWATDLDGRAAQLINWPN